MQLLRACAHFIGAAFAVLGLAGCATVSSDGGVGAVQTLTRERLGPAVALPVKNADAGHDAATVERLLEQPLTADGAVQVAFLNSPGVRASLAEVQIAEADLAQAGRLTNPRVSFGSKSNGDAVSIDRTILFNVISLIARPTTQKVAARQFEAAQLRAAAEVLRLARDTRRAWIAAVAAQQSARYFEQVKVAADAGGELADRMAKAGNFSKLAVMREQAFRVDAAAQLARANLAAAGAREQLTRLLGLAGPDALRLPDRLPELPAAAIQPVDAERIALEHRLDVQMAKRNAEAMAANLGLTRASRVINVLEAGYTNESNTGERRQNGYEVEIELPIFDWGDARLARSEAVYMQSVERTAEAALTARSEVRETYRAYDTAYDVARRFRDEIVPLRKQIAEEMLLRYNGMLIGVFDLLADARDQVASVNASLDALREFWLADAELQLALNGATPAASRTSGTAAMPAAAPAAAH